MRLAFHLTGGGTIGGGIPGDIDFSEQDATLIQTISGLGSPIDFSEQDATLIQVIDTGSNINFSEQDVTLIR